MPLLRHVALHATVAMIIGNIFIGGLFFVLGRAKKVGSAIGFVPASVISGFLSCIGYKVQQCPAAQHPASLVPAPPRSLAPVPTLVPTPVPILLPTPMSTHALTPTRAIPVLRS